MKNYSRYQQYVEGYLEELTDQEIYNVSSDILGYYWLRVKEKQNSYREKQIREELESTLNFSFGENEFQKYHIFIYDKLAQKLYEEKNIDKCIYFIKRHQSEHFRYYNDKSALSLTIMNSLKKNNQDYFIIKVIISAFLFFIIMCQVFLLYQNDAIIYFL